jgi:hypothetical protein
VISVRVLVDCSNKTESSTQLDVSVRDDDELTDGAVRVFEHLACRDILLKTSWMFLSSDQQFINCCGGDSLSVVENAFPSVDRLHLVEPPDILWSCPAD